MSQPRLGIGAIVILLAYLLGTLLLGFWAMRRKRDYSARDYFLGSKLTGTIILFFTMQATQYSGNAFFGFTGMAYRSGLIWILAVPLVCLIITTQISFAPRLYILSKKYDYITPTDYYADRFNSRAMRLLVALFSIISMFPYLMIQTEATGHAFVGLTSGRFPFWSGVVFISAVMLIYVVMGGWRGVVWTDTLQGIMLTIAIVAAAGVFLSTAGGFREVLDYTLKTAPEKLSAPDSYRTLTSSWLSLLIVSGIGFAMYPQAIQKIYAARSERALKRSLMVMVLVPFIIGTCTLLIGMAGWKRLPGLKGTDSDQIFALLLNTVIGEHYWLVIFILCGVLAAIMSTSSSVVLTLASIFTKDIYQAFIVRKADEKQLAHAGRVFAIIILALVVLASVKPTTTLWRLTEIKIEFLMQLFPPLILGLYWRRFSKWPALVGLLAGSGLVAALMLTGLQRWWYFQAGLYGFALNLAICIVMGFLIRAGQEEEDRVSRRFFDLFSLPLKSVNTTAPVAIHTSLPR